MQLPSGNLLVCDRENERVQILDPSGKMVGAWEGVHFPNNKATHDHVLYYVAELGNIIQGVPPEMRVVADASYARVTCRNGSGWLEPKYCLHLMHSETFGSRLTELPSILAVIYTLPRVGLR